MGQAKNRGTFEQRRDEAIEAGRIKLGGRPQPAPVALTVPRNSMAPKMIPLRQPSPLSPTPGSYHLLHPLSEEMTVPLMDIPDDLEAGSLTS